MDRVKDLFLNKYVCLFFCLLIIALLGVQNFYFPKTHSDTMLHYVAARAYMEDPKSLFVGNNDSRLIDIYGDHSTYPPVFRLANIPFLWNPSVLSFIVCAAIIILLWFIDPTASVFMGTSSLFFYWSGQADTGVFVALMGLVAYILLRAKKPKLIYLAALIAGLSPLTKPMFGYLMLPAGMIYLFFNLDKKTRIKTIVIFALIFLVPSILWSLRMWYVVGDPLIGHTPISFRGRMGLPKDGEFLFRGQMKSLEQYYGEKIKPFETFGLNYSFLQVDLLFYLIIPALIFYRKKISFEWVFAAGMVLLYIVAFVTRFQLGQFFQARYLLVAYPFFTLLASDLYKRIAFKPKFFIVMIFLIGAGYFSIMCAMNWTFSKEILKAFEYAKYDSNDTINAYHGWAAEFYTGRRYDPSSTNNIDVFPFDGPEGKIYLYGYMTKDYFVFWDSQEDSFLKIDLKTGLVNEVNIK